LLRAFAPDNGMAEGVSGMSTVKVRVCASVILALVAAGCSSSSGDVTISSLNERVATLSSRVEAADAARASAESERDDAQKAQAAREAERDAAKAERDALQVQLDARQAADQTSSTLTTTAPSSAALCTPEVLLPVVAGLFPENDRWNIVSVQISQCGGGYVRLFASADQSVCTSDAPQCLENEQVFLQDVAGTWTYLDSGTGLSCNDPQFMSLPIVPACEALSAT
jgi:hypothetical protein